MVHTYITHIIFHTNKYLIIYIELTNIKYTNKIQAFI